MPRILLQTLVSAEQASAFKARAKRVDRSVSNELRQLVRQALEGDEPVVDGLVKTNAVAGGSDVDPG